MEKFIIQFPFVVTWILTILGAGVVWALKQSIDRSIVVMDRVHKRLEEHDIAIIRLQTVCDLRERNCPVAHFNPDQTEYEIRGRQRRQPADRRDEVDHD